MPSFTLSKGAWKLYLSLTHSKRLLGVSSLLPSGDHILMWDFDDSWDSTLYSTLGAIQKRFALPRIDILATGKQGHYHAYCFYSTAWPDALRILASTKGLDQQFFRLGVLRGYWTLRIVEKNGFRFRRLPPLESTLGIKIDVSPWLIANFVYYQTEKA